MVKSIFVKEIRLALRDKSTYFWYFAMPIVFIVVFASIFGSVEDGTIKVNMIDADQTASSQQFIQFITGIDGFEVEQYEASTLDEQISKIRDGKMSSLVVIPKGFEQKTHRGEQAELSFYRDAVADSSVTPVHAVLQNIVNGYREGKLAETFAATGMEAEAIKTALEAPIKIEEIKENSTNTNMVTLVVPGYTVMFVFFIMITMVNNFVKDRNTGMLARLRSTPMQAKSYLIGMWIPNILIVLIQCIAILGFGSIVYDLALGDFLSISLIVIALSLCVTGIGLALCMFVKTENQGVAFVQIIAMGGAILGGLWFPIDLMPQFIQNIAKFVPQYWAQAGFQDVMLRNAQVGDIWPNLTVLLAFGAVGLLIASLRYKKYLQSAVN